MRISDAGLRLVSTFEGFRADAYPDPGSANGLPVTIGFGSTRWEDGSPIQLGQTVTRERAEAMLRDELAHAETVVLGAVTVPMTQAIFDACCSFVFNVGAGAFQRSTLLRKLNAGDYRGAADELLRWDKNDGRVMAGLTRRRRAERELFLSELPAVAPEPVAFIPEVKPMPPALIALLPSLVSALPELARLFGSGSDVSNRNIAAAQKVAEAVVTATGAPNLQGAVEAIQGDPDARRKASEAVQGIWYELVEVGGGIAAARTFNERVAATPAWRMPAVWVSGALLALVFMVVGTVLWADGWNNEIRLQVVTAVLTIIGLVGSFWLGSTAGSARKTDLLAERQP